MKKLLCIILSLMMVLSSSNLVATANQNTVVLSNLSDEECLDFIKTYGVTIPAIYEPEIQCVPFARSVIRYVEDNPCANFIFNYHVLEEFANDIKIAVNEFYGVNSGARYIQSTENILEDNVLHGDWQASFLNYRCYSYVLGYDYYVEPGEIEWRNSGGTGTYYYNFNAANVLDVAHMVEDDLISLGYTITAFSTTMPNTQVSSHTHLICTRKGTSAFTDYHFMRLGMDGFWYHKPGKTNTLKYLYAPSTSTPWVVEGYDGTTGLYSRFPEYQYDSEIYYIAYTTPHTYTYEMCGNGQHIGTCTICDYEVTLSCEYTYTYANNDTHNASCKYCNNASYGVSCTFSYTSNANGTHTRACNICDNSQTISCNLQYTNINNTRHSASCTDCDYYVASQICSVVYTSRGNKTHTASCLQCQNSYTGSCSITYSYTSADQHRGSCNKCDYTHTAACDYMTSYCGNSVVGDVHMSQCQTCGNISGGVPTDCFFEFKGNGDNTHSQICTQCRYIKSGSAPCMFKSDNTCRFCGAMKDSAVINAQEQEETL